MNQEQKIEEVKTDNTFVIGIRNGRITFIKSFDYHTEKKEAQIALKIVQNEDNYDSWNIGQVGQWVMEHKNNDSPRYTISIPNP